MEGSTGYQLPKKVQMLELLVRDGMQNLAHVVPTATKLWFLEQFIQAGYTTFETCNFGHPRLLPQSRDAEEVLKELWQLEPVKQGKVHLKAYGMTKKAFERAAEIKQKGYGPHSLAFTISAEDLHGRRNAGRTREEYFEDIPDMVKTARENGFQIDMAIACVYGSPCAGPVPIANTIELMERGLDLGIKRFTPCDTTGESNPRRTYEYMSALVDKFGKYEDVQFRIAHFHDARGMALANYVAAIQAGANVIETSLGQLGGQPQFVVDGVPGIGSGPNYCNSDSLLGNGATEDVLVMLDEMGIDTGVDIDRMLALGRVLEWVLDKPLRPYCTRAGRPIKYPVKWNIPAAGDLSYIPPYSCGTGEWAYPEKYEPASAEFIAREFKGRKLRWDPWEKKVKQVKDEG